MRLKRVMIASPKSGSGKTTVTCALLQILKEEGHKVVSYKCGPDYIDPMFHERVLGISAKNLDTFFTGAEGTREIFLRGRTEGEFAVLEGVMGLFDGLGGVREEGSSYHLAKVTQTPILLVVDGKGMGRSILAVIAGFLDYDTEHLIQGVILNRVSREYYKMVMPLIQEELKLSVLGYLPEQKKLRIESRYLGLVLPDEKQGLYGSGIEKKRRLELISREFRETVSVEGIIEIAKKAEELDCSWEEGRTNRMLITKKDRPVIAVARDEAFCFYYADNLFMLEENGAEIKYFSPLRDKRLPDGSRGLLIGGGYPELYAKELSENVAMLSAVRQAADRMPLVAECGGFLYLHSKLIDPEGKSYRMAGVLSGTCFYTEKLVRFGYIVVRDIFGHFLKKGGEIKGHEFHYYDSTQNGEDALAVKPITGRAYPCIMAGKNSWMGFPHLYYPSNPDFAAAFVEKARKLK